MPLIHSLAYVVGVLLLVAVILWAVNAFPYADAGVKKFIQIIVVVIAAWWFISLFTPIPGPTHLNIHS